MATPVLHRDAAPRRTRPMQRWEPFRELEELHERALSVLDGAIADGGAVPWVPVADIEETEDAWLVEAELPGVKNSDINVGVEDDEVAIHGEIKERERKGILRRRTRPVGRFELRVRVPGSLDADRVEAKLHDGVLTVRIPKAAESQPKRIEVQSES